MRSLSGDPPTFAIRYDVTAFSSPGLLSTVLAPFARRGLVPDSLRADHDGEITVVEVVLNEMPAALLIGCTANLRQLIGVLQVKVMPIFRREQDPPPSSSVEPP